jgi:hypothetical protein
MSAAPGRRVSLLWRGPQQRQRTWNWVWRAVGSALLMGAVASAVINVVAAVYGYWVGFLQLWAVIATAMLLVWSLRLVPAPAPAPDLASGPEPSELRTQPFSVAGWWQQRLTTTSGDVEWFDRVVRDRLVGLVSERLRQHHGLSLSADPERVRAVVGPKLHAFLTAPLPRTPTPGEMESLITLMKEI